MQEKEWNEFYKDDLDVLELLKGELEFIEKGGHKNPDKAPWLPSSAFQGTPICLNFEEPNRTHPCDECLLMELVPAARRAEKVPCHHIPLTAEGKTLENLGGAKTGAEIDQEVRNWLRRMIATLEGLRGTPSP
ncbi:MAG TPA: hypothetical protein VKV95_04685 [Terriglobia bacterium]|nr:hypothetical protein [Terriglobia bacterium]